MLSAACMLNEGNLTCCYLWINKQSVSLAMLPELILLKCGPNCGQEAAGGALQSLSSVLGRWESLACMSSGLHTFSLLDLLLLVLAQPSAQCQMKTRKSVPCHSRASERCHCLGISFCTPTPRSHFLLSLLSQQGVGGCTHRGC